MSKLEVSLKGVEPYGFLSVDNEYNGMDGKGNNVSPAVLWAGAPEGTKSFAVTIFDPDAPTGSGFWHWVSYDIPASVDTLSESAGHASNELGGGAGLQCRNDFGDLGYSGACPPVGDKPHRYIIAVHALSVDSLDLPPETPNAIVRFVINMNTIEKAEAITLYGR